MPIIENREIKRSGGDGFDSRLLEFFVDFLVEAKDDKVLVGQVHILDEELRVHAVGLAGQHGERRLQAFHRERVPVRDRVVDVVDQLLLVYLRRLQFVEDVGDLGLSKSTATMYSL